MRNILIKRVVTISKSQRWVELELEGWLKLNIDGVRIGRIYQNWLLQGMGWFVIIKAREMNYWFRG